MVPQENKQNLLIYNCNHFMIKTALVFTQFKIMI